MNKSEQYHEDLKSVKQIVARMERTTPSDYDRELIILAFENVKQLLIKRDKV